MKDFSKIVLKTTSTIRDALLTIDLGAMQIAVVLDDNNHLISTLTDGDIRRGLLKGFDLQTPVIKIMRSNPTTCSVNSTYEEIIQTARAKKIVHIPIIDDNNVLIGIEKTDELLRPKKRTNKVVLMVGGLGTRLRPLTDTTPKPLLKVGKKPILQTIIENFAKYGFTEIILSVNYKAEMIEAYFKDGSEFGVAIEYVHESQRMGTAGALSLMREKLTEPFFVMNGDLLTNVNFEHMLNYHISNTSDATMGVREYEYQVPYGVVRSQGHIIESIEEKPLQKFFVSAGIYLLDTNALEHIPSNDFYDMPTLFETLIANKKQATSFPIHDYWLDIGQIDEFNRANNEYEEVFK